MFLEPVAASERERIHLARVGPVPPNVRRRGRAFGATL